MGRHLMACYRVLCGVKKPRTSLFAHICQATEYNKFSGLNFQLLNFVYKTSYTNLSIWKFDSLNLLHATAVARYLSICVAEPQSGGSRVTRNLYRFPRQRDMSAVADSFTAFVHSPKSIRTVKGDRQWKLENGLNVHWSREPIMHCRLHII